MLNWTQSFSLVFWIREISLIRSLVDGKNNIFSHCGRKANSVGDCLANLEVLQQASLNSIHFHDLSVLAQRVFTIFRRTPID